MAEYGVNGTTLNLEHLAFRAQNASAWSADHVLLAGEIGVELDTKKYKLGDGTTQWSELGYYSNPVTDNIVSQLTSRVSTAESTLTTLGGRMDTAEADIDSLEANDITHESRMTAIEGVNTTQGEKITALETKDTQHESRMTAIEGVNTTQGEKITALETKDTQHESRMTTIEAKNTAQDGRLDALEGITTISANSFRS